MSIALAHPNRLKRHVAFLATAAMAFLSACATAPAPEAEAVAEAETEVVAAAPEVGLYELRIYTAADGKMAALQTRFRDHTIALFEKHGMTPILFSTPIVQEGQPADNRLFYIMGYKDRAARDASWRAFATDPEWTSVYQASQADGSLTTNIDNLFLTPTDYSPALNLEASSSPRTFELRTYKGTEGNLENIHKRFADHTMKIFDSHDMTSMLYWRPVEGQDGMEDKMVYLLAFPGVAARNDAWRAFSTDPAWQKVAADSQKDGPLLDGRPESVLLRPTDYSPVK